MKLNVIIPTYLIVLITFVECKLQQKEFLIPNETYNKYFIDSLEKDYNRTHGMHKDEVVNNGHLKNPIRIYFDITFNFTNSNFGRLVKNNISHIVRKEISNLIGVKYRTYSNLLIPRRCDQYQRDLPGVCHQKCQPMYCLDYVLDVELYAECKYIGFDNKIEIMPAGPGLKDVDLVIMLASYTKCDSMEETFSYVCVQGLKGRPIFGGILFCLNNILKNNKIDYRRSVDRMKHEILQIMGFQSEIVTSYVKKDGSSYIDRSDPKWKSKTSEDLGIIKSINRPRESVLMNYSKSFFVFTLENSKNFVRQHFNCSDLEGIDMVNKGGYYWTFDELKYGEDIMSTKLNPYKNEITVLTLIFLEDTGWYYGDYYKVTQFYNGQGLGCTFAKGGCYSYMKDKSRENLRPYCGIPISYPTGNKFVCSGDKKYYLRCELGKTKLHDSKYVYFQSIQSVDSLEVKDYSGLDVESEYCPIYKQFIEDNDRTTECENELNAQRSQDYNNIIKDYYGIYSKCIEYTKFLDDGKTIAGANCFKYFNDNQKSFDFVILSYTCQCKYNEILEIKNTDDQFKIDCGHKEIPPTGPPTSFVTQPIASMSTIKYANRFLLLIVVYLNSVFM